MNEEAKKSNGFVENNKEILSTIFFILLSIALISHFFVTKAVALTSICYGVVTGFSITYFILNKFRINKSALIPVISILGMLCCVLINILVFDGIAGLKLPQTTNNIYMFVVVVFLLGPAISWNQVKILFYIFFVGYIIFGLIGISKYYLYDFGYDFCGYCPRAGVVDPNYLPFRMWHTSFAILLTEGLLLFIFLRWNNKLSVIEYGVVFFIFMILHLIGARIGLIMVYSASLVFIFNHLIKSKNTLKYFFIITSIMFAISFLSYKTIIPLNNRINQTIDELKTISFSNPNVYASNFGYRIGTIQIGFRMLNENKLLGVGFTKDGPAYRKKFIKTFGSDLDFIIIPHNQFLKMFVALGIPFGIVFFCFFYVPLIFNSSIFVRLFYFIISVGFMTDVFFDIKYWLYSFCLLMPLLYNFSNQRLTNFSKV